MSFHSHNLSDDLLKTVRAVVEDKKIDKKEKDTDEKPTSDVDTVDNDDGKKSKKEPVDVNPDMRETEDLSEAKSLRDKLVKKVMKPIKDKEKMFPRKEDEDLDEMKETFALVDKNNKVISVGTSERDLKLNSKSLERKFGELKLVPIKKKQDVGYPLKEDIEELGEKSRAGSHEPTDGKQRFKRFQKEVQKVWKASNIENKKSILTDIVKSFASKEKAPSFLLTIQKTMNGARLDKLAANIALADISMKKVMVNSEEPEDLAFMAEMEKVDPESLKPKTSEEPFKPTMWTTSVTEGHNHDIEYNGSSFTTRSHNHVHEVRFEADGPVIFPGGKDGHTHKAIMIVKECVDETDSRKELKENTSKYRSLENAIRYMNRR